jgi:hypothetical protein
MIACEGLVTPVFGPHPEVEKSGYLIDPVPIPDGTAAQVNEIREMAAAFAVGARRGGIGDSGVIQGT